MSADRVLAGRYEVGKVIGRGGMANVHLGRDLRSGQSVAVKVLRTELAQDPLFHSRFRREAQTLAGLDHPAIISVLETGDEVVDNGSAQGLRVPFMVMEFVAGPSLGDLLKEGRLGLKESIHHLLGILSALDAIHRAGVVHRDIKPANVMVTPQGRVKVVDFGIAREGADPSATLTATTLTSPQGVLGTPRYLSPEQVRGEAADARSDLYSAGCLLYELLTGQPPFVGDDPVALAYQHVHEEPQRVSTNNPDLPPALDSLLMMALAKDRKDRFQTARAFGKALQSAAKGIGLEPAGGHVGPIQSKPSMALAVGNCDRVVAGRRERCAQRTVTNAGDHAPAGRARPARGPPPGRDNHTTRFDLRGMTNDGCTRIRADPRHHKPPAFARARSL